MILVIIREDCNSLDHPPLHQIAVIGKTSDLEAAVCKHPGDKVRWRSDTTGSHHTASAELYNPKFPDTNPRYITLKKIEFGEIIDMGD